MTLKILVWESDTILGPFSVGEIVRLEDVTVRLTKQEGETGRSFLVGTMRRINKTSNLSGPHGRCGEITALGKGDVSRVELIA